MTLDLQTGLATVQTWSVLAAASVIPLIRWRAFDIFSLPKFVVLLTLATVVLVSSGILLLRRYNGDLPAFSRGLVGLRSSPWVVVAGLLMLVLAAASLAADSLQPALLGPYRRWNGFLAYAAVISLSLVVAHRFGLRELRRLTRILAVTSVLAAGHGLLQWAELVDTQFTATGTAVFANLGNANFLAAYLAIGLPCLGLEVVEARQLGHRLVAATGAVLCLVTMLLTDALQGPAAAAAALATAAVLALWQRRRPLARVVLAGSAAAVGLVIAGLASLGPLAALGGLRTVELRGWYWAAALDIFSDHSLLGVGPGRYVAWFRSSRSAEAARELSLSLDVDGPHNVVLDQLVSGGLAAAVLLVAAWGIAGWAILRFLRSRQPSPIMITLSAAWVAYLAQAMVSLDTLSLLLVGWLLTASLVAVERTSRPTSPSRSTRRPRKSAPRRRRSPDRALWIGLALTGVTSFTVLVIGLSWLSADAALARSDAWRRAGELERAHNSAAESLSGPVDLALYQLNIAEIQQLRGNLRASRAHFERALEIDGRRLRAALGEARVVEELGQDPSRQWVRVLMIEPQVALLQAEGARAALRSGEPELAEQRARDGLELDELCAECWAALGRAFHEQGSTDDALTALERAQELGATDPEVAALLAELRE